jgi:hypothetical protein
VSTRPGYLLPMRQTVLAFAGVMLGMLVGAIMFVPLFVQGALGASATNSGVVLTPLMLALMLASVGSG